MSTKNNNNTSSFHLTESDIKLILDALHRDAQRCDDEVEDQLITGGNQTNITFYSNKASALRELAYDLSNGNCMPTIDVPNYVQKSFDPTKVKVFTPVQNTVNSSLPPLIANLIMPMTSQH